MVDLQGELIGYQPNPNEFGKCSSCGNLLLDKHEEQLKLCSECQRRQQDKHLVGIV